MALREGGGTAEEGVGVIHREVIAETAAGARLQRRD